MSEWKEYKLKDIIECFIDYRGKTPTKTETGIPLVTAKIVKNGRILEPNEFIANEDYESWMSRGYPEINDVVLTTEAPLGEVGLIKDKTVALAQRIITMRGRKKYLNNIFLKYYLQSNIGQALLQSRSQGTTVEGIKSSVLKELEISIPKDVSVQALIASILTSLDDKIDLLHRQNKTLEQLAETLFRQWFVEEADKNWSVVKVSDVAEINNKSISADYPFAEIKYLDTGSITKGVISNFQICSRTNAPSRAQRIVKDNDIVYSLVRPIQRHYGILHNVEQNTIASTGFCVVTSTKISPYFIYMLLTQDDSVEYFDSIAEGSTSTYPSLKPSDIGNYEFALPSTEKLQSFSEYAANIWGKIQLNQTQIRTLTNQRDALLPKLMSGEVKIVK